MESSKGPILVTGGAGFIGCALTSRLVELGLRVVVIDVLHPQVHASPGRPLRLSDEVALLPIDVTATSEWDAVLKLVRPSQIVHLAAETGTGQSLSQASRHARVNVVGTTEMLDALMRASVVPEQIVLSSSRAVYGEGEWVTEAGTGFYPGPRTHSALQAAQWDPIGPDGGIASPLPSVADRTSTHPTSIYGATKLAQEHILSAWCAATGSSLSILRFQNVYGPGQSPTNSYTGVVTLFASLARRGGQLPVYEDGRILRDFVYIEDVVDSILAAIARPAQRTRIVDVGSGTTVSIHEVARRIAAAFEAPEPAVSGQFRDGDVRAAITDIEAAAKELAYQPKWTLQQGIAALLSSMTEGQ
jgi:dTDP-L-rhamnose 4-epimerase